MLPISSTVHELLFCIQDLGDCLFSTHFHLLLRLLTTTIQDMTTVSIPSIDKVLRATDKLPYLLSLRNRRSRQRD